MRLKKWCKHIKIGPIGGINRYLFGDPKIVFRKIVGHWNYCCVCGKKNPSFKK